MKNRSTLTLALVTFLTSITFLMGSPFPAANAVTYTCAQGGACAVGDVGPGGGRVFYAPGANFTMTGAPCASTCRYLESAPITGAYAFNNVPSYGLLGLTHDQANETATIGSGYSNTSKLVSISSSPTGAGNVAKAYRGSANFSDWFLPSELEISAYWSSNPTDVTSYYR